MKTQIYRWARRHKDLYCDCCDPQKIVAMCPNINSYRPRKRQVETVDVAILGKSGPLKRRTVRADELCGWGE